MIREWLARRLVARMQAQAWPAPSGAAAASPVLRVLDAAARSMTFPMLDNGYVYLAATRLSLFRSAKDWAMAIEVLGFSPRSGLPDLSVWTFGSRVEAPEARERFVDERAFRAFLAAHPNDRSAFFHPIEPGDWQDPEDVETLDPAATVVRVRGRSVAIPTLGDYRTRGIQLLEPERPGTADLTRYLAAVARDEVLATPAERRISVPPGLDEILVLDEWHHPDLVEGELPSATETFVQLARVLESGNVGAYQPSMAPNTHWSKWPDGGAL